MSAKIVFVTGEKIENTYLANTLFGLIYLHSNVNFMIYVKNMPIIYEFLNFN